jgi:hypothetical protein
MAKGADPRGVMDGDPDPRQGPIAQGDMVSWLAHGTELGAQPNAIELVGSIEVRASDGPCDLFVFRFRTDPPHWAADRGWMIGVAGPYLRSKQPTTTGLGYTFSVMAREDAMTVDDHVDQLVGLRRRFHSASSSSDTA